MVRIVTALAGVTMGGRKCTICLHEQTAEISKAIAAGVSFASISSRFGVTKAAAHRHCVKCLQAPRKPETSNRAAARDSDGGSFRFGSNVGEIASPKDVLDRIQALFRLGDLLEEAYQRRDVGACVKLARELRGGLESYAKVAGWMTDGAGGNVLIDKRQQVITVLAKLSEEELRALARGDAVPGVSVPATALSGGGVIEESAIG